MKHYRIYDAKVWLTIDRPEDARSVWHRSLNVLAAHGWEITKDPEVERNYKAICHNYRVGRQGDLHVQLQCAPKQLAFEFWQDLVIEPGRTNGGRYSFNQRALMPYLIRLQWRKTVNQLTTFWESLGFTAESTDWPPDNHRLGMEALHHSMIGWKWHLPKDYDPHTFTSPYSYNTTTCDGHPIQPGQWYAFYYGGHLMQGQAFYSLNNNWKMLPNERCKPFCVPSQNIHTLRPGLPRREPLSQDRQLDKAKLRLDRLIKAMAFEQCISTRDYLRRWGG